MTAPVPHLLVDPPDRAPEGLTTLEERITAGVPRRIALDPRLALVVVVPTGIASTWLEHPVDALAGDSAQESDPEADPAAPGVGPRLHLLVSGGLAATVPLVAGLRRRLPDAGAGAPAVIDLAVLGWTLAVGTLLGPGEHGSRIRLAWRRLGDTA